MKKRSDLRVLGRTLIRLQSEYEPKNRGDGLRHGGEPEAQRPISDCENRKDCSGHSAGAKCRFV